MIAADMALAVLWQLIGNDAESAALLTALAAHLQSLQAEPVEQLPASEGDIVIGLKPLSMAGRAAG